jgi:uncharacterized membrane protein HdeD (DUF308 family)
MELSQSENVAPESIQQRWWVFLLLGFVLMVTGIIAIGVPLVASVTITYLLGYILVAGAIVHGVYAFSKRGAGRIVTNVLMAVFYLAAGLILIVHPLAGTLLLTLVLAILLVVDGILKFVEAIDMPALPHRGWVIVGAVIAVILGVMIWRQWPLSAVWSLGVLLGVNLLYTGVTMMMLGSGVHVSAGRQAAVQH